MIARLSGEQNHRCAYCGFHMWLRPVDGKLKGRRRADRQAFKARLATRDHLVPECEGGGEAWGNLVAACLWCNAYRGNQPADVAYERVQRLLRRGTHPHQIYIATGRWAGQYGLRTIHWSAA